MREPNENDMGSNGHPDTKEPLTVGVIGGGNMGGALLRGWVGRGVRLSVHDRNAHKVEAFEAMGIRRRDGIAMFVDEDVVIIAVKPPAVPDVVRELSAVVSEKTLIVSVAAGVPLTVLAEAAPGRRVVRAMPNTGAAIGRSTTTLLLGELCEKSSDSSRLEQLFNLVGQAVFLNADHEFHAAIALAGSGPAFVLDLIDAMIGAGVHLGLRRDVARRLAVGAFDAATGLVGETEQSPSALREAICSPGGTTIAGVHALAEAKGGAALWNACLAAAAKSEDMSR